MDTNSPIIVSITDFRRKAGAYISRGTPLTVVKGSRVVGTYIPNKSKSDLTIQEKLEKIKKLSGGLNLGSDLTPEKMNADYDKMYDEMLPR